VSAFYNLPFYPTVQSVRVMHFKQWTVHRHIHTSDRLPTTTDLGGRYICNIIVGFFHEDNYSKPYLLMYEELVKCYFKNISKNCLTANIKHLGDASMQLKR